MKDRIDSEAVLVDTSAWIEFFRRNSAVSRALEDLVRTDRVVTTGIVIFELIQGARSGKDKSRITALLGELDYMEMSQDLWASAGALARSLRDRGLNLPVSDVLLAAIALKHNLAVFTLDSHFDSITDLKRYMPETT